MTQTEKDQSARIHDAMQARRQEKIESEEYCVVVLDHDVVTSTQHFHAGQDIFCPAEPTEQTVKAHIMTARELCSLHGGKIKGGSLKKRTVKERAVAPEPIKAETPEDKAEK